MRQSITIFMIALCCVSWAGAPGARLPETAGANLTQAGKASHADPINTSAEGEAIPKDCTFTVSVTLDDGTTLTAEITIMDISWWNCTKIQVANFLREVF